MNYYNNAKHMQKANNLLTNEKALLKKIEALNNNYNNTVDVSVKAIEREIKKTISVLFGNRKDTSIQSRISFYYEILSYIRKVNTSDICISDNSFKNENTDNTIIKILNEEYHVKKTVAPDNAIEWWVYNEKNEYIACGDDQATAIINLNKALDTHKQAKTWTTSLRKGACSEYCSKIMPSFQKKLNNIKQEFPNGYGFLLRLENAYFDPYGLYINTASNAHLFSYDRYLAYIKILDGHIELHKRPIKSIGNNKEDFSDQLFYCRDFKFLIEDHMGTSNIVLKYDYRNCILRIKKNTSDQFFNELFKLICNINKSKSINNDESTRLQEQYSSIDYLPSENIMCNSKPDDRSITTAVKLNTNTLFRQNSQELHNASVYFKLGNYNWKRNGHSKKALAFLARGSSHLVVIPGSIVDAYFFDPLFDKHDSGYALKTNAKPYEATTNDMHIKFAIDGLKLNVILQPTCKSGLQPVHVLSLSHIYWPVIAIDSSSVVDTICHQIKKISNIVNHDQSIDILCDLWQTI